MRNSRLARSAPVMYQVHASHGNPAFGRWLQLGEPSRVKFGVFFELSVPRPFSPEREREVFENALEQARLADELGFAVRLGRRAPLPRGVLALVGAGDLPDRGRHADASDPRRPRRGRLRARDQPPDPRRRARRLPRHPLGRPPRVRHRALVDLDRDRRLPGRSRRHQEGLGRVRPRAAAACGCRSASRIAGAASRCPSARCCPSRSRSRTRRCG